MSEVRVDPSRSEYSETEKLRAMLDERGIEHTDYRNDKMMLETTQWQGEHFDWIAFDNGDAEAFALTNAKAITPEQAIAATVGAGTCRNTSNVTDWLGRKIRFVCSECNAWIDTEILWNPRYHDNESPWVKDCKLNYCPNCGARIEVVEQPPLDRPFIDNPATDKRFMWR